MLTPKEIKDLKDQMRKMDKSPKEWARELAEMDPLAAAQLANSLLTDINHELDMVHQRLEEESLIIMEDKLESDKPSLLVTQDLMSKLTRSKSK